MPVASMSMRLRIGGTQTFARPGMCSRASSSSTSLSGVMPARHWSRGLNRMVVARILVRGGGCNVEEEHTEEDEARRCSQRSDESGDERANAEREPDDAGIGEQLHPEILHAPGMGRRRVRLRWLVGEPAPRRCEVGLVAVERALEADAAERMVLPDAQADVGEHRPLRARLHVFGGRGRGGLDAQEREEVRDVVAAQRERPDCDDGDDRGDRSRSCTRQRPCAPPDDERCGRGEDDACEREDRGREDQADRTRRDGENRQAPALGECDCGEADRERRA